MADSIPTTYATIDVQTERLGELQQCLIAQGFQLKAVPDRSRERYQLTDDNQQIPTGEI